jgi:hypothetical protein
VLESPGVTDLSLREAAHGVSPLAEPWRSYVDDVRDSSYRITDAEVARLLAAGCTEDAVFELTIAAALGAAARRLEVSMGALESTTRDATRDS